MKKFQFMMLCLAAFALFSCKPGSNGEEPEPTPTPDPQVTFKSLIDVEDYTIEDWGAVPAEYLVKLKQEGETMMGGLDSIYVYADQVYLNLLVWPHNDSLTNKEIVPFHVYLNADGDNKTGGYDDWFLDGNAEWLLEGFLYEGNATCKYNPALFQWWGSMGGGITDQTTKTGWYWTDPSKPHSAEDGWGAIIPTASLPLGNSQALNQNKVFEIQILRSLIAETWASPFSVGFDIEKSGGDETSPWIIVGVLPNPTYDGQGAKVTAIKPKVTIDPTAYK